jgi:hypothetical protein
MRRFVLVEEVTEEREDFLFDDRERCRDCGQISAVGFTVPDEAWMAVVNDPYDILCIACFAHGADKQRYPWDKKIEFWPVSLATVLAEKNGGKS